MDYPLPFDAAGRTILITLCAGYLLRGGIWVRGLHRPRPELWLDDLGELGLRRAVRRWLFTVGPPFLELAVIVITVAWSGYALICLAGDLRENTIASLTGAMPAALWAGRVVRGDAE